ncbi:hypothetical protein jhhlp_005940 [Lomentospora prolificans]|uniref:Uncharacterized protein n=1 Tax=Lomentospora prolificans TaxID=41688 RepID=A0A2N3N4J0_9PEZI|nr:hypothetical protein jhhlp_005940 [Lomentospora prolificans]
MAPLPPAPPLPSSPPPPTPRMASSSSFSSTPSPSDRQRRIIQLADNWALLNLQPSSAPPPLTRPGQPLSFRTPSDDAVAEQLLLRHRQQTAASAPPGQPTLSSSFSTPLLKRPFSSKKPQSAKSARLAFDTLLEYVRTGSASPGVVEALVAHLGLAGAGLDVAPRQKSKSLLQSRRKSHENGFEERGQVLKEAVRSGSIDVVSVLVPYADPASLDASVALAIQLRKFEVIEILLRYGARVCDSTVVQDEFRKLCIEGGHQDIVGLILRSDGKPAQLCLSQALVDAATAGCLDTVMLLSHSLADANFNNAEALRIAIGQGRRDIALSIVMSNNPPQRPGLDEAVTILFTQLNMSPNDKLAIAELLLCAGAAGEAVDIGLIHAAASESLELVGLLVKYGASLTFQNGLVVRNAVTKAQHTLVEVLFSGASSFSSLDASECVELLPPKTSPESRNVILTHLLRRGANGIPLHNALVDAVEAGDVESARLLLTPQFPRTRITDAGLSPANPAAAIYDRHDVASVDHKGGLAFSIAVTRGDIPMTKLLLSAQPSLETLGQIFPAACVLSSDDARYAIVEAFLLAGLSGKPLDVALQGAISKEPNERDDRLISILLAHNASVNFSDGAGLSVAIQQGDMSLIRTLVGAASPSTAANAVASAMKIEDVDARREAMGLLLDAGAANAGQENISSAVLVTLSSKPVDVRMLRLLLEQAKADVSFENGEAINLAINDPDPTILKLLLKLSKPSTELVREHLTGLMKLPSTHTKTTKLQAFLPSLTQADLDEALILEVTSASQTDADDLSLSTLTTLLAAKADVNASKARALCLAISSANKDIVDPLLKAKPSTQSLQLAFPHAIHSQDPQHRFAFAKRLIKAGAPKLEATRALVYCIDAHTTDMPLLTLLAEHGDISDGIALKRAIRKESPPIVALLLKKAKSPMRDTDKSFQQAMEIKDRSARLDIAKLLLKSNVPEAAISAGLLTAVNDVDYALGKLLTSVGASLADCDSHGIVKASRSGSPEMLAMLLGGLPEPKKELLEEAFQAATEVGDLKIRTPILEMLLEKGVSGDVVNEQLISAARYGENGHEMLRMLLAAGATPNYNDGEAVCVAVRSATLPNLELLLGRELANPNQEKPSVGTLSEALKASWTLSRETRLTTIKWLFEAGLQVTAELHLTLTEVVNEEEQDLELIDFLLDHGASPLHNKSKAIINAAVRTCTAILSRLLANHDPSGDLDHIVTSSFKKEDAARWFTDEGLFVLKMLLNKAPGKRTSGATLTTIMELAPSHHPDLANSFAMTLLDHGVDVNYEQGKPLHLAASAAQLQWLQALLAGARNSTPTPAALSVALSHVFDADLDEDDAASLLSAIVDYDRDGARVDVMYPHPIRKPILALALDRHPRSVRILELLLDAGYYHDQMILCRLHPDIEEEPVTLLTWALLQPQKRISTAAIEVLVTRGAKVNFETKITRTSPIMLAIRSRRPDVVDILLRGGAEVDGVADATGASPLAMAVALGGDVSIQIMTSVLAAGASRNDGSLHNAARELNLPAVETLVKYGHDVDFPSPLHGGRTALAETCRHASTSSTPDPSISSSSSPSSSAALDPQRERALEKMLTYLIDTGSDLSIKSDGKSALHLALESANPVATTRALLKAGMWKHIAKPFNLYTDATHTYSPTIYVRRVLRTHHSEQLYWLLRANRCDDVFYAHEGPQPEGAVGLPDDLLREERARKARLARLAMDQEDHAVALARARALAELQAQIARAQADLEALTRKGRHHEELAAIRERCALEQDLAGEAARARQEERSAEAAHQKMLTQEMLKRTRAVSELELENEGKKAAALFDWEEKMGIQRVENARALHAIRVAESRDLVRQGSGRVV